LMGDKVDNIPGVPGVGEKTAQGLIQGIGGLDAIYADLERVRTLPFRGAKTMPEKLLEHREMAYLSHRLATIKTDVELPFGPAEFISVHSDNQTLQHLFDDVEFRSWVAALHAEARVESASGSEPDVTDNRLPMTFVEKHYDIITDQNLFADWLLRLESSEMFSFDTETTSLEIMNAKLVGLSFAIRS